MLIEDARQRLAALNGVYWHHTIRLFPDLVVQGGKSADWLEAERSAILGPIELAGRSVIDIGTWNGFFAFEAKRAGAGRVIATDSRVWQMPKYAGRETFELARACLDLDVEAMEIDPTELPGALPAANVVLFLGVFYHMIDPVLVLQRVAALATDLLIIETHQDLLGLDRPGMVFYPGATLNNDKTNWWGPNPACVTELLATVGFDHVFYQRHPEMPERGIYHAFRSAETVRAYLRRSPDNLVLFDLGSPTGRSQIFAPSCASGGGVEPLGERGPDAVRAERDAAVAETAALRASTSWRVTAPLRALSRIARGR